MRDDFSDRTKDQLAKRVGHRCSNPDCRQLTSGPRSESGKFICIGVASHITAAAPSGPRYDEALSARLRTAFENGIWLCQNCAKLIDNDADLYTVHKLQQWKDEAEAFAHEQIERPDYKRDKHLVPETNPFPKIEKLMPDLVSELRSDLTAHPLRREFVILKKCWSYWARGEELFYYYDDHPELDSKLQILDNMGLIQEITYNNTKRYLMTEKFVYYLIGGH